MSIEMDIRSRLVKELNGFAIIGDAKSDILAIFDDMLHAHERIVEKAEAETEAMLNRTLIEGKKLLIAVHALKTIVGPKRRASVVWMEGIADAALAAIGEKP